MGNHDISIDSYGENIEDRDTQQTVTEKRIELTQLRSPDPVSREKLGSCQGKIEATEEEIRHGEVDDKYGSCVADLESFQSKTRSLIMCPTAGWDRLGHLFTAEKCEDGDDVARETTDEEHDAAHEG